MRGSFPCLWRGRHRFESDTRHCRPNPRELHAAGLSMFLCPAHIVFNMSRTMSRGKIGPAPSFLNWSQALFSISTHAAATSACLSDARLCSLISARGDYSLGNPLLRLRLPRRNDSLWTRVAPAALAKKETGVRLNGLGSDRGMGRWRYVSSLGFLRPIAPPRPSVHGPAPARELARGGDVRLVLVDPALQQGSAPPDEPPHPLRRMPPGSRVGSLARAGPFEWGEAFR